MQSRYTFSINEELRARGGGVGGGEREREGKKGREKMEGGRRGLGIQNSPIFLLSFGKILYMFFFSPRFLTFL